MTDHSAIELHLRYDMRAPEWGTPVQELYAAALEQCVWADERGFDAVLVSEHHGSPDGYLPAPFAFASAVAARTKNVRIRLAALVLPLHDPVRVAEELAVIDIISGGRLEVVVAAGYVPAEFAMFGVPMEKRGARLERHVDTIRRLWAGETVYVDGRPARVRPQPLRAGGPPIYLAGATPLSARRAARVGDGYMPVDPRLYTLYADECRRLGRDPGGPPPSTSPAFLHLAEDVEEGWAKVGRHALHDVNAYAAWLDEAGIPGPYRVCDAIDDVRATGLYQVRTPADCLARIESGKYRGSLVMHPLMGGLAPEEGWKSLRLLERDVLPALRGKA